MSTALESVSADKRETLQQLLELYSYDFTRIVEADVNEDGRFDYPLAQLGYFKNPERKAYFIRHEGKLAGFVLIREENNQTFYINEFFVLYRYRSHGIGRTVAFQLFKEHKGRWIINQADSNSPAHKFWRNAVEEYTHGQYEEIQENGRKILSFES